MDWEKYGPLVLAAGFFLVWVFVLPRLGVRT